VRATATTAVFIAILFCQVSFATSIAITPTTTFSAETSNNTSAASTFTAQSNGNIAPANVSKVDSHTLLYPGATTKIYTHFMGWFGPSNHMNVGYSSSDPTQIQRQIDDQVSRGIDGAIIDWYGPGHFPDDNATLSMMSYAQTLPGVPYKFAVMEDVGALSSCANTFGCDLTKTLIGHLNYIYNTYAGSPAYITLNGQPAVFFFGLEKYSIDWDYVKANVPGNPAFIFQNAGGFTHADTAGGFSWVQINLSDPNDWQQWYLDNFYQTAQSYSWQHAFGVAYLGFNDTLAAWGTKRIVNQNCGQTWLNTWNEIAKYYSGTRQLENMQITTWNDYEEGTEIETGIENCVSISASLAGNTLSWAIVGNENTIDHYTVFVSLDGQNLMPIMNASTGVRTIDVSTLRLAPGSYTFYVKAVAKPSMTNKMSNAASYSVPDPGPSAVLNVTPTSGIAPVTVTASTAGSTSPAGTITASAIDFGDGTKVNAATATHTYAAAGMFTVTATVTDNMNLSASATALVTVVPDKPPLAYLSISPASGNAPLVVTASTAASTDPDGTIISSQINFGDGTVVNATTASHTYNLPGNYTITGTVTDNGGLTATASAIVNALMVPGKVTVSSPATGATMSSPVRIVGSATANTGSVITAMRVYVDNNDAYTVAAGSVDTYVTMTPGAHYVAVQAWDNAGAVYQTALNINVSSPLPAGYVTIISPANGAALVNAVHFLATATSQNPITAMRIYVDNVSMYTVSGAKVDTYLNLPIGTHYVVIQAWDSSGAVFKTPANITVKSILGRAFVN
jgi:PKD repeat protein